MKCQCGRKWLWGISRHCTGICWEGLRNTRTKIPQSEQSFSRSRFEPGTTWIQVRSITAWASVLGTPIVAFHTSPTLSRHYRHNTCTVAQESLTARLIISEFRKPSLILTVTSLPHRRPRPKHTCIFLCVLNRLDTKYIGDVLSRQRHPGTKIFVTFLRLSKRMHSKLAAAYSFPVPPLHHYIIIL
jgi:hypothetical protein